MTPATATAPVPLPERVGALPWDALGAGLDARGFAVTAPSLEDLFVGLTGEGFDVDQ